MSLVEGQFSSWMTSVIGWLVCSTHVVKCTQQDGSLWSASPRSFNPRLSSVYVGVVVVAVHS